MGIGEKELRKTIPISAMEFWKKPAPDSERPIQPLQLVLLAFLFVGGLSLATIAFCHEIKTTKNFKEL
jgi:hypothetical protein